MINEKADPDRVRGGYKAMASSIGMADNWQKVKRYMNTKSFKSKIAEAKEKSKEADDPDAYLAAVERRILAGHFNKTEDLRYMLTAMKIELGEIEEGGYLGVETPPSKHPAKDIPKKKRSAIVKKAKKGEDIGKKGKGFKKVADKAAKKYGSKEAGDRVAAAAMWKGLRK